MSDDAQMDGGDTGANLEDRTSNFIGVETEAEAVRYYGWFGLIHSVGAVLFYINMNHNYYTAIASSWYTSNIYYFAPVGFGWLMMSYFDGELMRKIYRKIVLMSLIGPFWNHWWMIIDYILVGQNGGKDWDWTTGIDGITAYDELWFYLAGALYVFYTVFESLVQLQLAPMIINWTETASIKANDGSEDDSKLFSNFSKLLAVNI